jgi:hypothetical protein
MKKNLFVLCIILHVNLFSQNNATFINHTDFLSNDYKAIQSKQTLSL